jgi:hypothetical protein
MTLLPALFCTTKDNNWLKESIGKVLNGVIFVVNIILGNVTRPRAFMHEPTQANILLLLPGCIIF